MSPQNKSMIHAFGLVVGQGRQIGQGRGFGFVQERPGHCLQCPPAGPIKIRCMGDLAKQASPFDNNPINISYPNQIGDPALFAQRIFVNGRDDLLRAGAVLRRKAVFQIAGNRLQTKLFVGSNREASSPAVFIAAKAKTGIEVGEVVNKFVQQIFFIFQRRGNCQLASDVFFRSSPDPQVTRP